MSKAHKYDVFISCGRTAVESTRTLVRQLETNGFVSSSRALDFGTSSSIDEVIQDFYQSAVCLLVYGQLDDAPWYNGLIGRVIKRRAERSRGEFRVISVLSAALHGWKQVLDSQHHFIDSDSVIEYADPFDDAAKFRELVLLIRGARQTPHKFFALPRLRQWIVRRAKNALNVDWSGLSTMSSSPPGLKWISIDDEVTQPLDSRGTVDWLGDAFVRGGFPDLKTNQSKLLFACSGRAKPHRTVICDLFVDSIFRSHIQYSRSIYYSGSFGRTWHALLGQETEWSAKSAPWTRTGGDYVKWINGLAGFGPRANESVKIVNLQPNSGVLGTTHHGTTFGSAAADGRAMMSFHVDASHEPRDTRIQCGGVLARLPELKHFLLVFKAPQPWDFYNDDKIQTFVIRDLTPERFDYHWLRFASPLMGGSACYFPHNNRSDDYGSSDCTIVFDKCDSTTVYRCSGVGNESPPKVGHRGAIVCKSSSSVFAEFLRKFAEILTYASTPYGLARLPQTQISYDSGVGTPGSVKLECFWVGAPDENAAPVNLQMKAYSCQGWSMRIGGNDQLLKLIGATHAGNDHEAFALADLRGPTHSGQISRISQNHRLGEQADIEHVTLISERASKYSLPTGEPYWEIRSSQQDCGRGRKESAEVDNRQSESLEEPWARKPTGVVDPAITFEVRPDSVVVVSQWHSYGNAAGAGEERIQ